MQRSCVLQGSSQHLAVQCCAMLLIHSFASNTVLVICRILHRQPDCVTAAELILHLLKMPHAKIAGSLAHMQSGVALHMASVFNAFDENQRERLASSNLLTSAIACCTAANACLSCSALLAAAWLSPALVPALDTSASLAAPTLSARSAVSMSVAGLEMGSPLLACSAAQSACISP